MREYSQFIEKLREFRRTNVNKSIKKTIKYCKKQGILRDYLQRKSSEVVNMLIADYDYDMDIKVQREEAAEHARAEGKAEEKNVMLKAC